MANPAEGLPPEIVEAVRAAFNELRPNVWVDTETGAWGTDITAVHTLRLVDAEDMAEFVSLTSDEKIDLAKAFGLPMKMIGCTSEHKE